MNPDDLTVLKPYKIGALELRNRIAFISTIGNIGTQHWFEDARIAYYAERAKGGVGLIITEGLSVHPTSIPVPTVPFVHDPELIPNFRRLADAVHVHGTALIGQLWHVGRNSLWSPFLTPWSASGERDPLSGTTPHAMSESEIAELIANYARSASNLEQAGFDGAELHGGHGYLLTQFMSPWSNRRTDRWGGSLENRCRFVVEVTRAVRGAVGPKFVVGLKFSAHEYVDGGIDQPMGQEIIAHLMKEAPLDFIEVTQSNFSPSLERHTPDFRFDDLPFIHLAAGIREVSNGAPVMAIAKIPDIQSAEGIVRDGKADLIGFSRPLVADPHLVAKVAAGQEPRPCIYCNVCWDVVQQLRPIACIYGPETGQELEGVAELVPAEQPQTVRVVGAGPAGLEVARVAAQRGHNVFLYEARDEAGGRLARDSSVAGLETIGKAWKWLRDEAVKAGVTVEYGKTVDGATIGTWPESDIIVQATGAVPDVLPVEGAERVISLEAAIAESGSIEGPVAIIDEIEDEPVYATAETLAARGLDVHIVTRRQAIGRRTPYVNLIGVLRRLDFAGVRLHADVVPARMEAGKLIVRHGLSGVERVLGPITTIVRAGPYKARSRLADTNHRLLVVGDSYSPRTVMAVVREANSVGRGLELLGQR
jgi:2,4-dienoyl-CoA reductase-like NADH-dependent reductase (Old Yellow Enzyme family)